MASKVYPKFKEALMQGASNTNLSSSTVKMYLIDTADYTYSDAHDMLDDVAAGARVGTAVTIDNKTFTNGVFDTSDDSDTFTSVTGDPCEAILVFIDTGTESTSRLVAYIDSAASGLPVTPNGGDIVIDWDDGANGIFAL